MTDNQPAALESFEKAFSGHTGSCVRQCDCGRLFFNAEGWDWEEGELEKLRANTNAKELDYAVGVVVFEGRWCVADCDCWKKRAERIIAFLDGHAHAIAEYLTIEKQRKLLEAEAAPVVRDPGPPERYRVGKP